MDYEQKYKKALSRAEELMSRCANNGDYKTIIYRAEDIESIFPELKEPEDDMIRKALLRGFRKYSIYYDTFGNADVNSIIAWLEKQSNTSVNIDIESMVSAYKQKLKSQGGVENNPLVNMYLTAFRHGVEETLEELNLKKIEKQGEKVDNGKFE